MSLLDPNNLPAGSLPGLHYHLILQPTPAAGGQGVVYPAFSSRTNRVLALKFYFRDQVARPGDLMQQLEFSQRVPDDLFARVYDIVELRDDPHWQLFGFTMDYLDWSLQNLIDQAKISGWKFPAKVIANWIRQFADAIAYLQANGKVHRDLKPDNLAFRMPRDSVGTANIAGGMPLVGDRSEHYHEAKLIVTDLGTLASVGSSAGNITANDRYKSRELYCEGPQLPSFAMDLYAFGKLIEDFRDLSEEPLNWLEDARVRCLDLQNPLEVGVLPRLVSPIWESQTQLYAEAGFETKGLEFFEGREWVFEDFENFEKEVKPKKHGGVFLITGPAGSGKSTLLRKWSQRKKQHQGFYFKVTVRSTAQEMVDAIGNQLAELLMAIDGNGREIIDKDESLRGIKDYTREQRLDLWINAITRHPKRPAQLLIFVDAIDETETAKEAEAVVKCLPKRLPEGVFLIISSRPALPDWDYLKQLRTAYSGRETSLDELSIELSSKGNMRDVERFLAKRLSRAFDDPQILKLAEHCGYVFLLAAFQAESILKEQLTLPEAISESIDWLKVDPGNRLALYYRQTWDRIMGARGDGTTRAKIADCLTGISNEMIVEYVQAMMAVLGQLGIDESSMNEWLKPTGDWKTSRVRNLNQMFLWFVEPIGTELAESRNPSYRVRHKSIRDFLQSDTGPIPPSDIRTWHGKIADYYLLQSKHTTQSPTWEDVEPYGKRHVVRHLLESLQRKAGDEINYHNPERWTTAVTILTSWDYLGVCINHPNKWV